MTKIKVFISYSHDDYKQASNLAAFLASKFRNLNHGGGKYKVAFWWDAHLTPGEYWNSEIPDKINDADLILFFVSKNFLNSEYIMKWEVPLSFERKESAGIPILSVFLDECDLATTKIGALEAIPKKGGRLTPLSRWSNKTEGRNYIIEGVDVCLRNTIDKLPELLKPNPSTSFLNKKKKYVRQFASPEVARLYRATKKRKPRRKKSKFEKNLKMMQESLPQLVSILVLGVVFILVIKYC
jgi:hypothetical protein